MNRAIRSNPQRAPIPPWIAAAVPRSGQERRGAGEGRVRVVAERRAEDRRDADPAETGSHPPHADRRQEREQAADAELPPAGRRHEVRRRRVGRGELDRVGERRGGDDAEHDPGREPEPPLRPPDEERGEQQEQRPDDVELLLDRERPVVLEGGRVVRRGEVVDGVRGEDPVHDVERRADRLPPRVGPARVRRERGDADRRHEDDEQRRGQEATRAPGPEFGEPDPGAGLRLHEVRGDEVAGDDEEDVDPGVARRAPRRGRSGRARP